MTEAWGRLRVISGELVDFDVAWDAQRELAEEVRQGAPAVLLLLQHPPVFTLGRRANPSNLLDPGTISVRRIDRGGDVTYHGPGQLVGYPLFRLRERRIGIREHVLRMERALISALAEWGIAARRRDDCVGVWTDRGKIASIGVRVSKGVTLHGWALNVSNDLEPFRRIHPCGMPRCVMTSVAAHAGERVEVARVAERLVPHVVREYGFRSWEMRAPHFACASP
ncbi:MAG: lipoyl(octanoyl) transferase LipB [Planctomycetes bacterium]|nr:lipoyl(octanoyl) transferase LipB [Planctomycetota bacterium]